LTNSPPSVSRLSRQCGIVNISQPYRFPRPVMGLVFFFLPFLQSSGCGLIRNHLNESLSLWLKRRNSKKNLNV
jgi:hypothetical protein